MAAPLTSACDPKQTFECDIECRFTTPVNRVRVSAQLIDATTELHAWAERYDRDLEDIFEVQDEITTKIVGQIAPELLLMVAERRTFPIRSTAMTVPVTGSRISATTTATARKRPRMRGPSCSVFSTRT